MTTKKTTTKKGKGSKGKADAEDLDAFARHLAEALRIARTSELFSARFYNDHSEAWNEFVNNTFHDGPNKNLWESEEYIRLVLAGVASRKGGAE